jgi:hypothetical protein
MNISISELLQNEAFLLATLIWTIPWKGVALWKASRNEQKGWFIAILLTNTFALLDALYIFYFSKKAGKSAEPVKSVEKS